MGNRQAGGPLKTSSDRQLNLLEKDPKPDRVAREVERGRRWVKTERSGPSFFKLLLNKTRISSSSSRNLLRFPSCCHKKVHKKKKRTGRSWFFFVFGQ